MTSRAKLLSDEIYRIDGVLPDSCLAKHNKMCISPFVFYRGSAQLFYADLASGSLQLDMFNQIPYTCIMGDCHTSNFGFLTEDGSHSNKVIFSPNDFDDACVGHAYWDLLRFCTSIELCVDHCQGIKSGEYLGNGNPFDKPVAEESNVLEAINAFLSTYLSTCQASMDNTVESRIAADKGYHSGALKKGYAKALKRVAGAELFELKSALAKAIDISADPLRFRHISEKFTTLTADLKIELQQVFAPYMDDTILDVVERTNAGTGSVNMQRYYFLVGPKNYSGRPDLPLCHIVEVKQQRAAAPICYFPRLSQINRLTPAHLTAVCQRRMQRAPDLVLDEVEWQGKHWLVRSRHHAKVGFDPEDIAMGKGNVFQRGFIDYASQCGKSLALAHCRGDRRSTRFEQAMDSALSQHKGLLVNKACSYAQTVKNDFQLFKALNN